MGSRITRKSLAAVNRQLQAQLKAAEGNTRKTLNARVHATEQENKKLKSQLETIQASHQSQIDDLEARIKKLTQQVGELSNEVSA
jgi:cell division protein FtsB